MSYVALTPSILLRMIAIAGNWQSLGSRWEGEIRNEHCETHLLLYRLGKLKRYNYSNSTLPLAKTDFELRRTPYMEYLRGPLRERCMDHSTRVTSRRADYHIAQSYISLLTRCSSSNPDHESKLDRWKRGQHLDSHNCCKSSPVDAC
jgi:hypothetical protein